MQLSSVLTPELIAQLKSITRKPRVYSASHKIEDFHMPSRGISGRKHMGGSRPSDLSTSNLAIALQHATVFGVKTRI